MNPLQVFECYIHDTEPWLRATALHALARTRTGLLPEAELEKIVERYRNDADPNVRYATGIVWARLDIPTEIIFQEPTEVKKEDMMLSTIERVIFLKEVPFFESMTIEQLRVLSSVSEELTFDEDQAIFNEGDIGDALFVIVSGRVGIERQGKRRGSVVRLATLESRQYFGEMTIFDGEPRSATALALEPTLLLRLGRAPLLALSRENPDLPVELLRVLSRRLREANAVIAEKSKARPRELERLYDKLG